MTKFLKKYKTEEYDIVEFCKGLFKIKKNFLHKKFYLFGLQIFDKRNSQNEYYNQKYQIILSQWHAHGPSQELAQQLHLMSLSPLMFDKMPDITWVIYIACLLGIQNFEQANKILEKYIYKFGTKNLHRILPVADFALQKGFSSEKIKQSSELWKFFTDKSIINSTKNYFVGKKIAVVGGSGCELGKNKGAEIDSHDIVVRFGNYPTDEKYFCDYGQKTTLWVRTSSPAVINKPDISRYDKVFWKEDFGRIINGEEHLKIMYEYMKNYNEKFFVADSTYYQTLDENYNIYRPTAGCLILWYFYNLLGSLENVDVYGFAFLSGNSNDTKHYFDNVCKISQNHDIEYEIKLLQKIYFETH